MELFANLLLYMVVSLGVGYLLRLVKNEDGNPKIKWYIFGLIIGILSAILNAVLAETILGSSFNLDADLGSFWGSLVTGFLIGLPIGLITGWDMSKRFSFIDAWLLLFKIVIIFVVIGGTISSLAVPKYSVQQWWDFFVFGLAQGGIYALIALGYTLVYGILFMINFAHGEVFMSGAFTAFFVAEAFAKPSAEGKLPFLETNPLISLLVIFLVAMVTSGWFI